MSLADLELVPSAVVVMLIFPLALLGYLAREHKRNAHHLIRLNSQLQSRLATLENRIYQLDKRVEDTNREPSKEVLKRLAAGAPLGVINSSETGLPIDPERQLQEALSSPRCSDKLFKAYNDRAVFSVEEIQFEVHGKASRYGRPNRWTWSRCQQIAQTIADAKPKGWLKVVEISRALTKAVEDQQLRFKEITVEEIRRRFGSENFHHLEMTQSADPFANEPTWEEHLAELNSRPEVQRFRAEVARLEALRAAQESTVEVLQVEQASGVSEQTPDQGGRKHETPSSGTKAAHRPGKLPRGVKRTKNGKYAAQRTVNGNYLSKGGFDTPEAAHQHYLQLGQSG